jgi:hypothetical protein
MKAAEISKSALFPHNEDEFSSILLPTEWKEMTPLTKNTRSYQYVKWGTLIAFILLTVLLMIVLATDWIGSSYFNIAYLFLVIIRLIKHPGNLFIFSNGIILNGKYYPSDQIKYYEIEKIIRWHDLYGLDTRVNNAYKLTINVKRKLIQSNFVVIEDLEHLDQIITLLENLEIKRNQKMKKTYSSNGKVANE